MKIRTGFAIALVSASLFTGSAAQAAEPLVGLLLGGTVGSLIGNDVSGRDGAVIGGMIGAAVGFAIANDMGRESDDYVRPAPGYRYPPAAVPVNYRPARVAPAAVHFDRGQRPARYANQYTGRDGHCFHSISDTRR